MCGILVAINKKGSLDSERKIQLSRALSELSFRGPDLQIERTIQNQTYFGQTILSLTGDVTKSKGEHLISQRKRFQIAFNGEIYNYLDLAKKYLTSKKLSENILKVTDTEVLVNLHEEMEISQVSKALDGMYAYTLLDLEKNALYLNRDPQGEKTLYIYEDENQILISSETRAFEKLVSLSLDKQVLKDYFSTRHFMFEARSLYNGVRQLLPGQIEKLDLKTLTWSKLSRIELSDFLDVDLYEKNSKRSLEDCVDELDEIFERNIRQMIPVNRHIATVVSGGIDSTLISSYVSQVTDPKLLLAVNHLNKDYISRDLKGFEKYFKQKVQVLNVDQVVYAQVLNSCQRILSAPIYSHSFVGQSIQSQYARGEGCTAMFGGEGADELFGGYSAYNLTAARKVESRFSSSPYSTYVSSTKFYENDSQIIEEELSRLWKNALIKFSHIEDAEERSAHAMMYCDLSYQLPAVGLRGADQMSMMWSIETRSVFLRRDIIKFGLNLPMKFKADPTEDSPKMASKKILKKLFSRRFSHELILPKQGFSGFPNEAGVYLGSFQNFQILDYLQYSGDKSQVSNESKEFLWKIINLEYFLRSRKN